MSRMARSPPWSTPFPYTTLFRSRRVSRRRWREWRAAGPRLSHLSTGTPAPRPPALEGCTTRSEEHTSELQSQSNPVCRLLLEKKKEIRLDRKNKRLNYSDSQISY